MNAHVAFIDDETSVLNGLRRGLTALKPDFRMSFYADADEAMAAFEANPADLLVTEVGTHMVEASRFLDSVLHRFPSTIRFVLSGQTDQDLGPPRLPLAHQVISKPCPVSYLKEAIEAALSHRPSLANARLAEILTGAQAVPTPSAAILRIQQELRARTSAGGALIGAIEGDPGLAARLLQVANSVAFAARYKVERIGQAVDLLGLEQLDALVTAHGISSSVPAQRLAEAGLSGMWSHAADLASLARRIAQRQFDAAAADAAFVAGLLHDVGALVLAANAPAEYAAVIAAASRLPDDDGCSIASAERKILGASHAEMGAYVLGLWGLSDAQIRVIARHADSGMPPGTDDPVLFSLKLANALLGDPGQRDAPGLAIAEPLLAMVGVGSGDAPAFVATLRSLPGGR